MAVQLPPLAGSRRRVPGASPLHEEAEPTQTADRVKRVLALLLFLGRRS